jgi:hypothetical protein
MRLVRSQPRLEFSFVRNQQQARSSPRCHTPRYCEWGIRVASAGQGQQWQGPGSRVATGDVIEEATKTSGLHESPTTVVSKNFGLDLPTRLGLHIS